MTYPEAHIQELVRTINTLRVERDSARRMYCSEIARDGQSPGDVAAALGWDITSRDNDEQ